MNKRSHILMLLIAAFLWGTTFVAQSIGADHVGAWTYLAGRSWIAVLFLTPIIPAMDRLSERRGAENRRPKTAADRKKLFLAGLACGYMLCAASVAQQHGMAFTTASKAGFITALYVVIVPILSIFIRRRPPFHIWLCVLVALIGMYLLCMTEEFSIGRGDAYVLLCALVFAFHILTIDHFSSMADGVKMSCIQFLTAGLISAVLMLIFEEPRLDAILSAWLPLLYAGVMSCGVAYTFQIIGQKDMDPTIASLILSLESVISVLAGWAILHQKLSVRELFGCLVMFAAIILAQLPERKEKER